MNADRSDLFTLTGLVYSIPVSCVSFNGGEPDLHPDLILDAMRLHENSTLIQLQGIGDHLLLNHTNECFLQNGHRPSEQAVYLRLVFSSVLLNTSGRT